MPNLENYTIAKVPSFDASNPYRIVQHLQEPLEINMAYKSYPLIIVQVHENQCLTQFEDGKSLKILVQIMLDYSCAIGIN